MSSYIFKNLDPLTPNNDVLNELEKYAEENKKQMYFISGPLLDGTSNYNYKNGVIVLSPKRKIAIINLGRNHSNDFRNYVEDIKEDIAFIIKKYDFNNVIGRIREWGSYITDIDSFSDINKYFEVTATESSTEGRITDIITSLFLGSINDADKIVKEEPASLLEKVKHKIQLFDTDQTRFIYDSIKDKKIIRIQGLSGTGKTELLLHKLKELYVKQPSSKICITCHNRVLADSLKKRIPNFFNFMKVDMQIDWEERLWCVNAWGSQSDENSGVLSYICHQYEIPFYNYRMTRSFKAAVNETIIDIKRKYPQGTPPIFTYMFIDESQDFDENFFELCALVTEKTVFIAGDTFQSIFDHIDNSKVKIDYQLSRCYRTDPKTLMYAHALGLGLFEKKKLTWMNKAGWEACGYNVEERPDKILRMTREPIRRFEDIEPNFKCIQLIRTSSLFLTVIKIIKKLKIDNPSITPEDIGIIFLDKEDYVYEYAPKLRAAIIDAFDWEVNLAHETKKKIKNTIFISNRNNVKGLEFSFVICITIKIIRDHGYRNALYTMLSRSFLQSFLIIPDSNNDDGLSKEIKDGLTMILENGYMDIHVPTQKEEEEIKKEFELESRRVSFKEKVSKIFDELNIDSNRRQGILQAIISLGYEDKTEKALKRLINNLVEEDE